MNINLLSGLPIDLFIQQITYLPFDNVITICTSNKKLHNYCTNSKYNSRWKKIIDDTFGGIYNYDNYLKEIRNKLNINDDVYNYLVYSHLVKVLDLITQLMIYYRQGDMKSFDDPQFTKVQRFLALFLLGKKDKMMDYLPNNDYLLFISMLEGHKIDQDVMNYMLMKMTEEGSVRGVSLMLSTGANVHDDSDKALRWASGIGHLDVVKYLMEHGADIHADNDFPLRWASQNGHLDVVKYLVEHGADIHAWNDNALVMASKSGHLEIVKYLIEQGADTHAFDDEALRLARKRGHLDVVNYLKDQMK